MIKTSLLCTAASVALFTLASCAGASAASFDSNIGSSGGLQFDQSLQDDLQPDTSPNNQATQAPGSSHELTLQDFVNADKNSNGYLDRDEFKALAAEVKKENEDANALAKVRKFSAEDANHDGKISAQELGVLGAGVG